MGVAKAKFEVKRAPGEAPFLFAISLRLEVSFQTEEEVTAEAVERITTSGTKQPERRLTIEQVIYASVEAEVRIYVKADADVVVQHIGEEYLRELIGILGSKEYDIAHDRITCASV